MPLADPQFNKNHGLQADPSHGPGLPPTRFPLPAQGSQGRGCQDKDYQDKVRPLSFVYKVLGSVLVACFLLIGLAGLILPIIPGIVFLFLAIYVLTRVSRRASAYAHRQPWFNRHVRHLHATNSLTVGERVRLAALMAARGVLNGILWCVAAVKRDRSPS